MIITTKLRVYLQYPGKSGSNLFLFPQVLSPQVLKKYLHGRFLWCKLKISQGLSTCLQSSNSMTIVVFLAPWLHMNKLFFLGLRKTYFSLWYRGDSSSFLTLSLISGLKFMCNSRVVFLGGCGFLFCFVSFVLFLHLY